MAQQIINIGAAPNDGSGDNPRAAFNKCNDNFTELYTTGAGTTTEGIWNFNQSSTDTTTAPASGRFRTNSGDAATCTQLAIHRISINGADRANTLRTQVAGDIIKMQDKADADTWARLIVQALPVDNGTWFQIDVAFNGGGGTPPGNNQEIIFAFAASGGGTAAPVGAEYITSTADARLTNERVLTDTATVTWDRTTAGQIKANAAGAGGSTTVVPPQGRLTLQTGVPVMTITQAAKTTIYYTPYQGNLLPITTDGASFVMTAFAELSQTTTDTTKSPAAVAAFKNYDLFVWEDGGTLRCTRGPAWSTNTARGIGAGTSELVKVAGFYLNAVSITNGPAAQRGTYVGTVWSNAAASIDWIYGAISAGGTAGCFFVWNAYNRRRVESLSGINANNWTYASTTVRAANGSNTIRHSFVCGLEEDAFSADYCTMADTLAEIGIGYDVTNAFSGRQGVSYAAGTTATSILGSFATTALGFHFFQACEASESTSNFFGDDNVPTRQQSGLVFRGWL